MIQLIRKLIDMIFVRHTYVIAKTRAGVKYYYMGENDRWTPVIYGAKQYKKKPKYDWILPSYNIEKI